MAEKNIVQIEISVSNGLVGCRETEILEFDRQEYEDLTEEQIEESCFEHMLSNMIEWNWKPLD